MTGEQRERAGQTGWNGIQNPYREKSTLTDRTPGAKNGTLAGNRLKCEALHSLPAAQPLDYNCESFKVSSRTLHSVAGGRGS